jgi:hypothetical protein
VGDLLVKESAQGQVELLQVSIVIDAKHEGLLRDVIGALSCKDGVTLLTGKFLAKDKGNFVGEGTSASIQASQSEHTIVFQPKALRDHNIGGCDLAMAARGPDDVAASIIASIEEGTCVQTLAEWDCRTSAINASDDWIRIILLEEFTKDGSRQIKDKLQQLDDDCRRLSRCTKEIDVAFDVQVLHIFSICLQGRHALLEPIDQYIPKKERKIKIELDCE